MDAPELLAAREAAYQKTQEAFAKVQSAHDEMVKREQLASAATAQDERGRLGALAQHAYYDWMRANGEFKDAMRVYISVVDQLRQQGPA